MTELVAGPAMTIVELIRDDAQPDMNVEIHNRCSVIDLISPSCFSDGAIRYIALEQKVAPGDTMNTAFGINSLRMAFEGALIYRLRRKETKSGRQLNIDVKNIDKSWPNYVQLLVGWKMRLFNDPRVYMLLIKHKEKINWTKDRLMQLHKYFRGRLHMYHGADENTWLMEDGSVLKLELDSRRSRECEIKITISEALLEDDTTIPVEIESKLDDDDEPKPIYWSSKKSTSTAWKGDEVEFVIENQVKDIALQHGTCNILEGKRNGRFSATIRPGKLLSMKIGSSKKNIGPIRCCLTYELVKDGQEYMAMMGNYRAFLAIEVFSTTIVNACTVSAVVFIVKDRAFAGEIDDVEWLHDDVLRHYCVGNGSFKYNMAGRILELDITFQPDRQARIKVVLKETNKYHEYGPLFHRAGRFAVSSENVAKYIHITAESAKIDVERQHYHVIENRIESAGGDRIYIQRIDIDARDNKQTSIHPSSSKHRIFNGEYQIYQQEMPSNEYYGRFIYCIGIDDTKNDEKTVCIIVLNQTISGDELDGRSSFNYGVAMFYISIPLQEITTGQPKQPSDTEFKKYIIQASTEWDSFLASVKTVSFNSGRLWEMPIQFTGHKIMYLSIHEPLPKPSVLNVVLQKHGGISETNSDPREDQLPTVCIKIRNYYPKSDFQLKRYTYTNTPLSEVPNRLTRVDPGSPDGFDMIKFKLLPSALVDTHEPHTFILHYCCENDDKLGFHLGITMAALKHPDNTLLIGSFDIKIEMRYVDENLRKTISNSSVKYSSSIFVENGKYNVESHFCKEVSDVLHQEFTMTARHKLISDTSSDSEIDLDIMPVHSQS